MQKPDAPVTVSSTQIFSGDPEVFEASARSNMRRPSLSSGSRNTTCPSEEVLHVPSESTPTREIQFDSGGAGPVTANQQLAAGSTYFLASLLAAINAKTEKGLLTLPLTLAASRICPK